MFTNQLNIIVRWRQIVIAPIILALLTVALLGTPGTALADFSYTVKSGDNLTKIARQFNTTIEAIVAANKTKFPCLATNPACLQVGWTITIPGSGGSSAPSGPGTYTVQSGDSLAKIARRFGVDLNALIAANKQARPCLANPTPCPLQIGWTLTIPGGGTVPVEDNPAAVVVEYVAAINARDVARFKATIHPDVPGYNDPQLDEDLAALFVLLEIFKITFEVKDVQVIERSGDTARVSYVFRVTSQVTNETSEESGIFILKKHNGQWKIFDEEFDQLETTR